MVEVEVQQELEIRIPRWKLDKAKWNIFQKLSIRKCQWVRREDIVDGHELIKGLFAAIIVI